MSTIVLKVNNVDKSNQVIWDSVQKVEVLTKEPDSLIFSLRNYGSKTFRPALGDDITLFNGATKIFGGIVISAVDKIEGLLKYFEVTCKDYTQVLDRMLVAKAYSAMTANAIIADIISEFTTGITGTNVNAPITVATANFNYLSVSQSLQKLTTLIGGGYDWYIDYDKDIHFFQTDTILAPFSLTDTSQNFLYGTLELQTDTSQLRNSITVRGGDVNGTAVDNKQVMDGQQRVIFVGYNLTSFLAYKALAATPTTFVALTVGADGKDDPTLFDTLYNPDRGLLTFPDASKPAINDVVKYTGIPVFPIITKQQDIASVAANGIYEYLILDKTITSKDAAKKRAAAEILNYGNIITTGQFTTLTSGLRTGQTITINSAIRGINDSFKIQKITTSLRTPSASTSDLIYNVEFVSTIDVTLVDVLNKLLIRDPSDQIIIGQNEIIDRIYTEYETITATEVVSSSKVHNPHSETITATEATNQAKNAGTIFVAGPYTPANFADTKRVFVSNGSLLG